MIRNLSRNSTLTRNEIREIMNLSPLPEPFGSQIPARGEYYDITANGGENDAGEN